MKDFLKKYFRISLVAILALGFATNCNEKEDDDTLLLLGAFLLSQQSPTWSVTMNATLKESATTNLAANNAVTLTNNTVTTSVNSSLSKSLVLSNGATNVQVFATTAAAGVFTISFTVNSAATALKLAYTTLNGGGNADTIADYGVAAGQSTFNLVINDNEPTNILQVTNLSTTSKALTINSIRIVRSGTYNNPNPTVGELVCDGNRLSGSPIVKSGTINAAETWSGGILLQGTVTANAPITVQPGTVIFGQRGSSLFVLGANKLTAIGTAADPICWTSASSLGSRQPGDWGGIVTVGNSGATRTSNTEGTTPQPYGSGSKPGTNNVEMAYNIIEFGGNEVAPGDELNNLSMYASNTILTNVQAHRGLDDQFEAWGGVANWNKLLATGGMDDDYDLDEGITGTITNIISHKYPIDCGGSFSTDPHGFEMDGTHAVGTCPGYGCSAPTISKITLIGTNASSGEAMRIREGFAGTIQNGVAYNFAGNASGQVIRGGGEGGFPANTGATLNNFLLQSGKTGAAAGTFPSITSQDATLAELPIVSAGSTEACGFGTDKPDYTLKAAYSARLGGADGVGKFWENWAVFRGR